MVASAEGIDVSSWQYPLTASELSGYDFAFCKATEGETTVDPDFAENWAAIREAGIVRGCYHEFHPADPIGAQVQNFATAVKEQGLRAGDIMAVVASDYAGVTGSMIAQFCTQLADAVGSQVVVMVYTDESVGQSLNGCGGWPLWVAAYGDDAPGAVGPWGRWHFWQYSESPEDQDAFNGTAEDLRAWIATYTGPPVEVWTCAGQKSLAELCQEWGTESSTTLRLTCENSPGRVFSANMAAYVNEVVGADTLKVPQGVSLMLGGDWFVTTGNQTLQGIALDRGLHPAGIIQSTAEASSGGAFAGNFAAYLNSVFSRSTVHVPAGIHLWYES